MSESNIEWTEHVWNPTRGCSRISPGCLNCYAERDAARKNSNPKLPGYKGFAIFNERHEPHWTGKVELIPEMLDVPLRRRKPTVWFVNSMSDLFHEKLPDTAIDAVFASMAVCPQHTFQVLTKRAERMRIWTTATMRVAMKGTDNICSRLPLPNVWLGVSVENQEYADIRIPQLLQTPAAVRFLSCEPLLGPLEIPGLRRGWVCASCLWPCINNPHRVTCSKCGCKKFIESPGIDWVIVGGESGPGARLCDTEWIRSIVEQCSVARVPCFVKQLGGHVLQGGQLRRKKSRKGSDMHEWEHDLRVRQMPSRV